MTTSTGIDLDLLKSEIKKTYASVSQRPEQDFVFPTGRAWAEDLDYPPELANVPESAAESFAGVANPFSLSRLKTGEHVVDLGSGGGFDCFIAADQVGSGGRVIGIDMTEEMLGRARATAAEMGLHHVEFREGLIEELPVEDGSVDAVISNGVINLCADKRQVFTQIMRVLRPGGRLQFADIANGKAVPESAIRNIDLWTG